MDGALNKEGGGSTDTSVQSKVEYNIHRFLHLKPLSIYSRMMYCNQKTSPCEQSSLFKHFTNFKVEIVNTFFHQGEAQNSSCDDGQTSPSRKFSFDCDVDVLGLSPISTDASDVFESVGKCQNSMSSTFQRQHEQKKEITGVQIKEDMKKNGDVTDDVDEGNCSTSFTKLPVTTSSPLPRAGEEMAPQDGCQSEISSAQAILSAQLESITDSGLCSNVFTPVLNSLSAPVRCLQGDEDDIPHIGLPIFESSICHSDLADAGCEITRELSSKELQRSSIGFIDDYHTTQEEDVESSYEVSSPTKFKVKSVVVAPKVQSTQIKPVCPPVLERNGRHAALKPYEREYERGASQRPNIFNGELDLEKKKKHYISLVNKHMNDKGNVQDVTTELHNLMNQVADQTPVYDTPWQHPSNLTQNNYQRRLDSSTPKMSLVEWQTKNCKEYKRFATVPKVFNRSALP